MSKNKTKYGPDNPHPLSTRKTELVWEGKYDAENIDEAKFIVYAHKPDSFMVKVPKKIVSLTNSINDYERYLKDLKAKLFEAIFSRTLDHKQADMIVQQIFIELALPEI